MVQGSAIESWCLDGKLPDKDLFIDALVDDTGLFTDVEGQYWDFKETWPFSYSDPYFAGICRLICAFANSSGGLIIFGVNDRTRQAGKNKVRPNIDKLSLAFNQLTGQQFEYDFKSYPLDEQDVSVDALLVKARPRRSKPITFKKDLEDYSANVIWIRAANEVLRAQPQHYASLFLSDQSDVLEGSIPPSTSQIRRFIGRAEAMTELFDWLQNSDEPRTYLHGKGGSGKITIAREFARLVKASGRDLSLEGKDKIDLVLFISAKERELISADAEVVSIDEPDFFDEDSLLKRVIYLSGGEVELERATGNTIQDLRNTISEYFDSFSYLIVIDDIDTLTTKGIDPGSDFLYRAVSRAKKASKVLYTIRNAPSQSLHNSIEVPGLSGEDYVEFVDECVVRFKTPRPDPDFRNSRLLKLSEGRPLVIESIIALARTAGGYAGAERLFNQNIGDTIRDYVFSREWESLGDGQGRLLLAALSDLNKPVSFDDLKIILQSGDSTVRDAVGAVREMFLSVDDAGDSTLYSLAPLTRSFVHTKKSSLKFYPAVKVRVQNFKKTIKVTGPEVARLVQKARGLVPLRFSTHHEERLRAALSVVRDATLQERVTEDPIFRALKGYVEAIQLRPDMGKVREDFLYSIQMKHEPEFEELMAWFRAEKSCETLEKVLYDITDVVISGRKYSEDQKIGMLSRKATTAYNFAKQRIQDDPDVAARGFYDSLILHLRAYKQNAITGSPMLNVSAKYARNTADQLFRLLATRGAWEPIAVLSELEKDCEGYLDPLAEPLLSYLDSLSGRAWFPADRSRLQNAARRTISKGFDKSKWVDTTLAPSISAKLSALAEVLRSRN
jgi:hypothetical protein